VSHEPFSIISKKLLALKMEVFQRKSHTSLHKIYFWTATIHNWLPLLETDQNKQAIIDSLKYLSGKKLITVYAFVIMPNHIHLIWQQNELNGNETAKGSLLKHTAHLFLKQLEAAGRSNLYEVDAANKKHEIWQRDSLGIEIYSRTVAKQKLDYIHFNPVSGKWQLAKDDISYTFSSARFYETGIDDFGFLNDLYTVFDGE
jgi:putative transposase